MGLTLQLAPGKYIELHHEGEPIAYLTLLPPPPNRPTGRDRLDLIRLVPANRDDEGLIANPHTAIRGHGWNASEGCPPLRVWHAGYPMAPLTVHCRGHVGRAVTLEFVGPRDWAISRGPKLKRAAH